ncbi:hypothetical protein BDZ97DRAFT_1282426 [Flammula alnicola]|nr:hypothetical protein BDZ97DRAFT_1282426 [Flammula alnicola]
MHECRARLTLFILSRLKTMAEHTAKSMAVLVTLPVYAEQDVRTNRPRTKEIIDPSYPLLEVNRGAIASIKRCTFKYGSTEEHQLNICYPPVTQSHTTSEREERRPILVFFYGGGLLHEVSLPLYRTTV